MSDTESPQMEAEPHTHHKEKSPSLTARQWLTIGIILFLVGGVLLLKQVKNTAMQGRLSPEQAVLPQAQLEQLLSDGQPIMVFFHSTTCDKCLQMMETVNTIYPEFDSTIALVDVDVYDSRNQELITRSGINMIPTLIFVDRNGDVDGHIGVIEAGALRDRLQALVAE